MTLAKPLCDFQIRLDLKPEHTKIEITATDSQEELLT